MKACSTLIASLALEEMRRLHSSATSVPRLKVGDVPPTVGAPILCALCRDSALTLEVDLVAEQHEGEILARSTR